MNCQCGRQLLDYWLWWEGCTVRASRSERPFARKTLAADSADALRAAGELIGQPYHDVVLRADDAGSQRVIEGLCRGGESPAREREDTSGSTAAG